MSAIFSDKHGSSRAGALPRCILLLLLGGLSIAASSEDPPATTTVVEVQVESPREGETVENPDFGEGIIWVSWVSGTGIS